MTSTALVPLDIVRLHLGLPREATAKTLDKGAAIRAIKRTLHGICIEGAISILDAFGYKHTDFHYMGNRWDTSDLTNEEYYPELQGRMAHETPVFWFWGGPPTRLKWYEGTLQTVLEDRVLCEIESRGIKEVAKWIGVDLTGVLK